MRIDKKFHPHERVNMIQKKTLLPAQGCPISLTKTGINTFQGIDNCGLNRVFNLVFWRPAKIKNG